MGPSRTLPDLPSLEDVRRDYVLQVLELCHGNGTRAARLLHINRKTLYSMLRRWRAQGFDVGPREEW